MPLPPLTDAEIKSEEPLDEDLMKDGLRDRDNWLWEDADNGGSGIDANVGAFLDEAFGTTGHSHNGDPGQGQNIDTAGIANDAASQNQMFQDNCVSPAKIAANTLLGTDFDDLAVTPIKMSGTMGYSGGVLTGSATFDITVDPTGIEANFQGDRIQFTNPKGEPGVICNERATATNGRVDFFVVRQFGDQIIIGFDFDPIVFDEVEIGTWEWEFSIV